MCIYDMIMDVGVVWLDIYMCIYDLTWMYIQYGQESMCSMLRKVYVYVQYYMNVYNQNDFLFKVRGGDLYLSSGYAHLI